MGGKNVERRLLTPDTDLRHRGAGRLCATGHSYLLAVANPADRIGDGSGVVSARVGRPKRPRIRLRSGTGCLSPMVRQSAISPSAAASSVISPRGPTISRYSPLALPTPQSTTLQLAAGTQTYLQAQWLASWQVGYPEADFSFAPNTFAILTMPPQVAEAYLPTLTYLGQR